MTRSSRIAVRILCSLVILAAALYAFYWFAVLRPNPHPPQKNYPKPASALQAQRQDLDYFRKLVALDRAYAPPVRAAANAVIDRLAASHDVLDRDHLRIALMYIAAMADNGHTSLGSAEHPNGRSRLLSLRLTHFSDGVYVMRARKADADLLGAKVIAVDGTPIDTVMVMLSGLRGGTKAHRLGFAVFYANATDILAGLGISPSAEHSTWTFLAHDGRTVTRTLSAYQPAYDEADPFPWRYKSPDPVKGDTPGLVAARPQSVPLPLQDGEANFRTAWLDTCIFYVQLRANEGKGLTQFLHATEKTLHGRKACAIILDNRDNGGGNYTLTHGFATSLHDYLTPGGHLYLLTGPDTFSAGITTSAFVKQATPAAQFTQLGEPVGDRMIFWAEGGSGCLPNAPFCMHYAAAKHDYRHGCQDWDECFWLNRVYPARVANLDPAETIPESFADWRAGRDPVFDRALALARGAAK